MARSLDPFCLSIPVSGSLGCFCFSATTDKGAMNMYKSLCRPIFSFHLGVYLGAQWIGLLLERERMYTVFCCEKASSNAIHETSLMRGKKASESEEQ